MRVVLALSIALPLLVVAAGGCAVHRPASPGGPVAQDADRPVGSASVIVRVTIRSTAGGDVALALFDSADAWRGGTPFATTRVAAVDGLAGWTVSDLRPGRYAIKAYQDLDGDGVLARGSFGRPSEPFGFSSGARAAFGPPSFEAAAFDITAGQSLTIEIELD